MLRLKVMQKYDMFFRTRLKLQVLVYVHLMDILKTGHSMLICNLGEKTILFFDIWNAVAYSLSMDFAPRD